MIISVHLPKTAGSSFSKALKGEFGKGLHLDYGDYPINTPVQERRESAMRSRAKIGKRRWHQPSCIHGHFLPMKYLPSSGETDTQFVTWLRNPVDRLISHYNHWRQGPADNPKGKIRNQMCEENWSLQRFCLGDEMRDLYSEFLWNFPLERFDFVGITEHFGSELVRFSAQFLENPLTVHRENLGSVQACASTLDPELRANIENHHGRDMRLYERALALRNEALNP